MLLQRTNPSGLSTGSAVSLKPRHRILFFSQGFWRGTGIERLGKRRDEGDDSTGEMPLGTEVLGGG